MAKRYEFIDLRKELAYIGDRYSFYWAALRSAQLDMKCLCLDSLGKPKSLCTSCMETGHLFVDKLVKIQRARSLPGIDLATQIGNVNTSSVTFIMEHGNKPKNSDWLLELDLDESTGSPRQPIRVVRAFKIQDAFPARGKDSRIEFWYCHSEERNFKK